MIVMSCFQESGKYSFRMPNKWNFSFDYLYGAMLILAIYVPGSPHMYRYMLVQRSKALSKSKKE
ncbi:Very-long-chain (3R)-3-hydroxyacyl-CoA dehydratase PASTICCINO 2, partial [Cucurbita argyrosperma subsp. argyrosperma]